MTQEYKLPQAAQDVLGGVKAAEVQDKYTQECRIDKESGKLYTRSAGKFAITDIIEGNPAISNSSAEWRVPLIEAYGQSTQVTTTGKNVIPTFFDAWESGDYDVSTGEKTKNSSRVRTKDLYPVDFTSAFAFSSDTTFRIFCRGYDESGAFQANIGELAYTGQKNIPAYVKKLGFVLIKENSTTFSEWQEIFNNLKIMVCNGTLSTEYEPYTGGAPSPSPDYPQEIKDCVVTGVKVTGKNLFDPKKLSGGEFVDFNGIRCYKCVDDTTDFIFVPPVKMVGDFYFSVRVFRDLDFETANVNLILHYEDKTTNTVSLTSGILKNYFAFPRSRLIGISISPIYKRSVYIDLTVTQLEYGAIATSYEPYKEKAIPLSTPITLRGIPSESGNVTIDGQKHLSDYIGQKEGVYGVFRKTQEIVDNGSNRWGVYTSQDGFYGALLKMSRNREAGLCNQAQVLTEGKEISSNSMWIGISNITVYFLKSSFYNPELPDSGLANWKAHLAENPLKIITVADEEVFEPLPEPDQQTLKELKTFYPTSIISWETEDGVGAWTKAEIKCDLKSYILEKIQEIKNNSIHQIQNINSNFIR